MFIKHLGHSTKLVFNQLVMRSLYVFGPVHGWEGLHEGGMFFYTDLTF